MNEMHDAPIIMETQKNWNCNNLTINTKQIKNCWILTADLCSLMQNYHK